MNGLKGKKILIIDDADDIRLLSRKVLENEGAEISEAHDVEAGFALALEKTPDLIVLDLEFIGNASGFDFLETRHQNASIKKIPVIVFTSKSDKNSIVEAVTLGASDYLVKPFRSATLLQKVRKCLVDHSFQRFEFEAGKEPDLHITVPTEIAQLTEFGFNIESSTKFEPDQIIKIHSELFRQLGVEAATIKTSSQASVYLGPGRYLNRAIFSGIGENFVKRLRKNLGAA